MRLITHGQNPRSCAPGELSPPPDGERARTDSIGGIGKAATDTTITSPGEMLSSFMDSPFTRSAKVSPPRNNGGSTAAKFLYLELSMRSSRLSSVSRMTILPSMEVAPSYSKPPVREALIDIRISPLAPTQLPVLEALHEQLRSSYPTKKKQQNLQGLWEWREETLSSRTSQRIAGFQFESSDGTRIVQYRLDGFTCTSRNQGR